MTIRVGIFGIHSTIRGHGLRPAAGITCDAGPRIRSDNVILIAEDAFDLSCAVTRIDPRIFSHVEPHLPSSLDLAASSPHCTRRDGRRRMPPSLLKRRRLGRGVVPTANAVELAQIDRQNETIHRMPP
jgi:hypothetical protein